VMERRIAMPALPIARVYASNKYKMIRQSSVYIHSLIFSLFLFGSCSQAEFEQKAGDSTSASTLTEQKDTGTASVKEMAPLSKKELNHVYSQAISDFMQVMYLKDSLVFDSLFLGERNFGTEDDFPEINLPKRIGSTRVVMVSVGEAHGAYKQRFNKTNPFINLMGWVNKSNAEFIFICFYPEFKHQYDCYLNYVYEPSKNEFVLEDERFEVLMEAKGNKAPHFAIYKQGKYIGDKAIQ